MYRQQGHHADAINALKDGLRLARSKYDPCEKYGDTEWELGHLPEAVQWWIKSIVVQVSTKNLGNCVAFLHLSYVAEQLGPGYVCSDLRRFVDRMRIGEIRLNAEPANKPYSAARSQGTASMRQALDLLDQEYLT